jgi:hypothetical protein
MSRPKAENACRTTQAARPACHLSDDQLDHMLTALPPLAELMVDGSNPLPLEPFRAGRFNDGKIAPHPEAAV